MRIRYVIDVEQSVNTAEMRQRCKIEEERKSPGFEEDHHSRESSQPALF